MPEHTLTFVGTATTLLRLGTFTLLTDPNFLHRGQRAYLGKGLWSKRLTDPALEIADLPPLDAVLLSHLHGDHFDRVARRELARDQPVLTTPQAARTLSRQGFETVGLPTWGRETLERDGERLSVEALPAVHARGLMGRLLPPVMGSLLEHSAPGGTTLRVYVTGDTLTGPHVDEIARRHPSIDVAVVHLGGTRVLRRTVTLDAPQGVDLVRRARPREVVPVHHDDYGVFRDPLTAFLQAAAGAGLRGAVRVVAPGETIDLLADRPRVEGASSGP
ncbi:MAG: hypothetical protein JWR42_846 [Marmoricola sp.]|nr:hypothetical protein [Marmoricola sp.]